MFKGIVYGMLMFAIGVGTVVIVESPKPTTIDTGSGYVRVKEIQAKELEVKVVGDAGGETVEIGKGSYKSMQDELERGFKAFQGVTIANEVEWSFYPTYVYRVVLPDDTVGIVKAASPVVKITCPVGMLGEICALSARNTLETLAVKP